MLKIKRAYQNKESDDGARILVDRLWPRGLPTSKADINEWAKEVAPSDELRRWFGHKMERWPEFRQRYIQELSLPEKTMLIERIARMAVSGNVTLVYAARDSEHNNARVLEELIAKRLRELSEA